MNGHLGDRVTALVDGQLSPAAAERALAHVTGCRRCSSDLAAARAARRVLSDVDDVRPAGDLTARLLALGAAGPPGAGRTSARSRDTTGRGAMEPFVSPSGGGTAAFTEPRKAGSSGPSLGGSPVLGGGMLGGGPLGGRHVLGGRGVLGGHGALTGTVVPARRGLRVAVGSLAGLGVVTVTLFLLGDRPPVVPVSEPSAALALLGGSTVAAVPVVSNGTPAAGASTEEYLSWMRAQGWACPTEIPDGWAVTSVLLLDEGARLALDLSGPEGDLVVTEQHGRLDLGALTAADRIDVDGHSVYLLSTAPWHVAWQSGEMVVEVVSAAAVPGATTVVGQFPDGDYDTGLQARLTRGWDTFTAAVRLP